MNVDLHCHSNRSDGVLSPSALVQRAAAHGVDLLALTDHDEVAGLDEAAQKLAAQYQAWRQAEAAHDKAQQSLAGRLNSVEIVAKVGFGNDKTARPSLRIAGCGTTVEFEKERRYLERQRLEDRGKHGAGHAVTRIDHHHERPDGGTRG